MNDPQPSILRPGGVSYLRIPAPDPAASAAFYEAVFGWAVSPRPSGFAFEDVGGLVIGHFLAEHAPAGEDGVRPYVCVEDVDAALGRVQRSGGEIVTAPYAEGNLRVATFKDPGGNVVGVWQGPTRAGG